MNEDSSFFSDEINDRIDGIMESWLEIKRIEFEADCCRVEAFEQAENGCLYLVKYRDRPIGSVLHYSGEVIVTKYFDIRGMEVGICM